MATTKIEKSESKIVISAPDFRCVEFTIEGLSPLVMNNFSQEALDMMKGKTLVKSGTSRKSKEPKDYTSDFEGSKHLSTDNWIGFPCGGFRRAAVDACRIVGFKMTMAKLGIFIRPDGFDSQSGQPLVRIYGAPQMVEHAVRLATGVASIKSRAMFQQWTAKLTVDYDGDMFSLQDLYHLFMRVGLQVGIGAGRPNSKDSTGMGWGTFKITTTKQIV